MTEPVGATPNIPEQPPPGGSGLDTPALESGAGGQAVHSWTGWDLRESLAVFIIGVALMNFIHVGTDGDAVGVSGHDSFYHIKMAALIPEHGLLHKFQWLKFTWFVDEGDTFVSHHYGFHMLLLPFVTVSHWLTGDYLPGARWAIATTFGLTLMLFNLILITGRVRWRWFWLFCFLLLPFQFFTRHAFIRAISPSLMMMLLITLLMFRRRYKLAGLAVLAYTHLYLGGVIYAPLLVVLFVASAVVGPRGDRYIPWRLMLWTTAGWAVGIAIHPYVGGMLEFLELQVFGSGLSPDIAVGREWKPYEGVWWFAQMSGNILLLWSIAVCLRFRLGPRLSAEELFLLLANFAFLLLTFKARRFIEYWPMFCLLSSAFLAAPMFGRLADWFDPGDGVSVPPKADRLWGSMCVLFVIALALCYAAIKRAGADAFLAQWPLWTILALIYLILPLRGSWLSAREHIKESTVLLSWVKAERLILLGIAFLAATACFAGPQLAGIQRKAKCGYDLPAIKDAMDFLAANSEPGDVVFTDDWDIFPVYFYYNSHNHYIVGLDPKFTHARRPDLWQRYVKLSRGKVPATVTVEAGAEGDSNGKNQQIQIRLEDIREHFGARFVVTDADHKPLAAKLAVAEDFAELIYPSPNYDSVRNAPYLVFRIRAEGEAIAREPVHLSQNERLPKSQDEPEPDGRSDADADSVPDPEPPSEPAPTSEPEPGSEVTANPVSTTMPNPVSKASPKLTLAVAPKPTPVPALPKVVYLSSLSPISVEQGWGDFVADFSVGGGAIHVGGKRYSHGLGTHTPSSIVYPIPRGYDRFKAIVGINRSTKGQGSAVVSVKLDNKIAFASTILTGTSDPARIDIPLGSATHLLLEANPTKDGKQNDHVDWADARFIRKLQEE